MNNKLIVAATIAAAGIATYFFRKKYRHENNNENFVGARSHHLTNAFTRAKNFSTRTME